MILCVQISNRSIILFTHSSSYDHCHSAQPISSRQQDAGSFQGMGINRPEQIHRRKCPISQAGLGAVWRPCWGGRGTPNAIRQCCLAKYRRLIPVLQCRLVTVNVNRQELLLIQVMIVKGINTNF
jgi:hypothetical protein